jgi:hypothetical protein
MEERTPMREMIDYFIGSVLVAGMLLRMALGRVPA